MTLEALRRKNTTNRLAAEWVVRLKRGELNEDEYAAFAQWILEPQNERAFRSHHATLIFAQEWNSDRMDWYTTPKSSWRRVAAGVAVTIAVLILGFSVLWLQKILPGDQLLTTRIGEVRSVSLPDGSIATLDTLSQVKVHRHGLERTVTMLSGRAMFDVKDDVKHPFIVEVDRCRIRVLGTQFDVYRDQRDKIVLHVFRGSVEVSGRNGSGGQVWSRTLRESQSLVFDQSGVLSDVRSIRETVTWPLRTFEARDVPLADVVAELNRYTERKIIIADSRLNGINIVATLPLDDVPGALQNLRGLAAPMEVDDRGGQTILRYSPVVPAGKHRH